MPSRRCCCDKVCGLPPCWTVVFDNIDSCVAIEKSWTIPKTGASTWSCVIPDSCTNCGDQTISVSVDEVNGTVTVTALWYTWNGDYADCQTQFNMILDGKGDETVSLSPTLSGHCACACSDDCPVCGGDETLIAGYLEVVISGLTEASCCSGCSEANGTYLIPYVACAYWEDSFDTCDFCPEDCNSNGLHIKFEIRYNEIYGIIVDTYITWAHSTICSEACGLNYQILGVEAGPSTDCESFTYNFDYGDLLNNSCWCSGTLKNACDASNATVNVTTVGTD